MQPTTEVLPTTEATDFARPSLATATGDQCPTCGAPVAGDQRYCVECGERQGRSRFALRDDHPAAPPPPAPRRRRLQASSATTLIAGVATLLVAMAVGVLIGHSGNDRTAATSPPVRVVTVPGAAAAAAPTATPAATTTTKSGDKSKQRKSGNDAKAKSGTATPKAVKTPPPTVALGSPGKGPGYKHGKFTGDFFGP
jgi:hypothetical protein